MRKMGRYHVIPINCHDLWNEHPELPAMSWILEVRNPLSVDELPLKLQPQSCWCSYHYLFVEHKPPIWQGDLEILPSDSGDKTCRTSSYFSVHWGTRGWTHTHRRHHQATWDVLWSPNHHRNSYEFLIMGILAPIHGLMTSLNMTMIDHETMMFPMFPKDYDVYWCIHVCTPINMSFQHTLYHPRFKIISNINLQQKDPETSLFGAPFFFVLT